MSLVKNLTALTIISASITSFAIFNVQANEDKSETIELTEKEQSKLDKILLGRKAEPAKSCIPRLEQKKLTIINDNILIYSRSKNAKTIYMNKPVGGCPRVKGNTLTHNRPDTSLCSGEIAQVVDLVAGITVGGCAFSEFIPYTRE